MRQRWDAEQQRWVDEDEGGAGTRPSPEWPGEPERPWWAGAETQADGVWPPSATPPPAPPSPPYPGQPSQLSRPSATADGTAPVADPVPGSRPRTVLVLITVLAVLAGGGAGAGVWWLARDHSTHHAGAGPSVTATATRSPAAPPATTDSTGSDASASATAESLTGPRQPSPGYSSAVDPVGYRVNVPEGWVRTEVRGVSAEVVTYTSPDDGRSLKLFEVVEHTPAESLDLAENGPEGFVENLSGYRVLDRSTGSGWAELDYRYDSPSSGATQVVDRRFTAADGTLYAIRSSGPEGSDVQEPFTMAYESFCPTGASCPSA